MALTSSRTASYQLRTQRPAVSRLGGRGGVVSRSLPIQRKITQAGLFGWDPLISKEEQARRRAEQEEAQRQVLLRRRKNSWQKDVQDRRAEVKRYATDKEYKKQVDEERRKAKPKKEDPGLRGIIIPLPPFGDAEMDGGERFDLKSPWIDEGWSDPTDNPIKEFGRLFSGFFSKKEKKEDEKDWQGIELARRASQALQGKGKDKK